MCENEVPGFYIITIFGKNCYLSVPLCLKSDDIRIMINFDAISADCFESVNINVCVCFSWAKLACMLFSFFMINDIIQKTKTNKILFLQLHTSYCRQAHTHPSLSPFSYTYLLNYWCFSGSSENTERSIRFICEWSTDKKHLEAKEKGNPYSTKGLLLNCFPLVPSSEDR